MGGNDSRLAFHRGNSLFSDHGAQFRQELRLINTMFAAGIRNRMEAGDRTPHTVHPMVQEGTDRHGPAPHHVVNELGCFNGHRGLQALVSMDIIGLQGSPLSFFARHQRDEGCR